MSQINHQDAIVTARDTLFGGDDEQARTGAALPIAQDEVDELLYGEGIAAGDRLNRLLQLREEMRTAGAADAMEGDATALLAEISRAISELQDLSGEGMDPASVDHNPEDHRETLSPDDDALLDLLDEDEEEEADLFGDAAVQELDDDVLDPKEWDGDGDGFDSGKGVH